MRAEQTRARPLSARDRVGEEARTARPATHEQTRSGRASSRPARDPLRVDFILITLTGNLTRYLTIRPLVSADPTVSARWYPIRTWVHDDRLRWLPGALRVRLRHLLDSARAFHLRLPDAAVVHAFETTYLYALYLVARRANTVLVLNPDGGLPGLGDGAKISWLRRAALERIDLFVPWSNYAAEHMLRQYPALPRERLRVLHPGITLAKWPFRGVKPPSTPFRLLFVGGDLERKGISTLLDALDSRLLEGCEVDVATQSGYLNMNPTLHQRLRTAPALRLHLDLAPGSAELMALYRSADALVHPTRLDTSSWVALEAMASGVPVVITPIGGIPDIVIDGKTGLHMQPNSPQSLASAVNRLRMDESLRVRVVEDARRQVEDNFNAERNTPLLFGWVREIAEYRRTALESP